MGTTVEIKAAPGKEITFTQIEEFVSMARRLHGAGELGTTVRAGVRFNGTLRSLSIEVIERKRDETGKFKADPEGDEFLSRQY